MGKRRRITHDEIKFLAPFPNIFQILKDILADQAMGFQIQGVRQGGADLSSAVR